MSVVVCGLFRPPQMLDMPNAQLAGTSNDCSNQYSRRPDLALAGESVGYNTYQCAAVQR